MKTATQSETVSALAPSAQDALLVDNLVNAVLSFKSLDADAARMALRRRLGELRQSDPTGDAQAAHVAPAIKPCVRLHITATGSWPDVQAEVLDGGQLPEDGAIELFAAAPSLPAASHFRTGRLRAALRVISEAVDDAALQAAARDALEADDQAADAESRQASQTPDRAEAWRESALAFERRAMRVEAGVRSLVASMEGGFIQADFDAKLIGTKREFNDAVARLHTLVAFDSAPAGTPREGHVDNTMHSLAVDAPDVSVRDKGSPI